MYVRIGEPFNAFTIAHESGHLLAIHVNENLNKGGDDFFIYEAYWKVRGLPGTAAQQEAKNNALSPPTHQGAPREMFADDFALLFPENSHYMGGAQQTFGVAYPLEALVFFYAKVLPTLKRPAG